MHAHEFDGGQDIVSLNGHALTITGILGGENAAGAFAGSPTSSLSLIGYMYGASSHRITDRTWWRSGLSRVSRELVFGLHIGIMTVSKSHAGKLPRGPRHLRRGDQHNYSRDNRKLNAVYSRSRTLAGFQPSLVDVVVGRRSWRVNGHAVLQIIHDLLHDSTFDAEA